MFDQINKYKASFGRLFEAKTLKVMLEIALLTILLSFLGPIKNMIYTEVVNKLSLGITVKLGIIMFASYIVVQVIEECVSYFQIYLNTVLQLKLGQSVSHEINNKLAKVKLNSLEMYEIHDLVSRANQTIKSSIVSSLNLIIALYTPLATIVLQLASLVWVAWYVPILIAVFNVPYIFILVKSNHRRYELERKITKEKRVEKYFVELLSDRYAAKDIRTYDLVNFFFSKMIDVKEKITLEYKRLCQKNTFQRTIATVTQSMAMAMALLLTGYLVIKKKTPIGAFVLVYNTGRNLQSAVSSFVGTISTWDQFGTNFADWNRLMNLEEEPEGDEDCIDKIHEIEMKNVEFRYPQRSESAVKNITLNKISVTPKKTKPQRIEATVEDIQNAILSNNKTMHFAITICELVIGIVRRFLKVSLSRSIKKRSAATIPKMQGRSSNIPKPITDCHRASKAAAFVAYLFCAVFR